MATWAPCSSSRRSAGRQGHERRSHDRQAKSASGFLRLTQLDLGNIVPACSLLCYYSVESEGVPLAMLSASRTLNAIIAARNYKWHYHCVKAQSKLWSIYGPIIVSQCPETNFGSHPCHVVSVSYEQMLSVTLKSTRSLAERPDTFGRLRAGMGLGSWMTSAHKKRALNGQRS
jgi:hypothetical protein